MRGSIKDKCLNIKCNACTRRPCVVAQSLLGARLVEGEESRLIDSEFESPAVESDTNNGGKE